MTRAVIFTAILVIHANAASISFPNLQGGVLLSAFPGMSPVSSSWGNCGNTQEGGLSQSNHACVVEKLKSDFGYEEAVAKELVRLASQTTGATAPMVLGSRPRTADEKSRKAMCIAAEDCKCKLTQDWCTIREN